MPLKSVLVSFTLLLGFRVLAVLAGCGVLDRILKKKEEIGGGQRQDNDIIFVSDLFYRERGTTHSRKRTGCSW